ncbi:MAG TPA: amidase family protein [Solirubrobacteraceae bacterium]|nr:amidase family protein [Solirubrobacteraceae bacterium]
MAEPVEPRRAGAGLAAADEQECDVAAFVPGSMRVEPLGLGALAGVRVALKDVYAVAGRTSSFGHPRWRETHEPANADSSMVSALRHSGAHIVGLTKMDQLAYSLVGDAGEGDPPQNVFDPEAFCGGSSSGSASAVAAGIADLGVCTDTVGSARVPAAACGLFGLRTTHGMIDKRGLLESARSFDVPGFLARSPATVIKALDALGFVSAAPDLERFERILAPVDLRGEVAAHVSVAVAALAERLVEITGARHVGVRCGPFVSPEAADLCARIQGREVWAEHGTWIKANTDALTADMQWRLGRCEQLAQDRPEVVSADATARAVHVDDLAALTGGDLLVLPLVPEHGPLRAWDADQLRSWRRVTCRLTGPSSLAGRPEVVVPCRVGDHYASVSIMGPPHADAVITRLVEKLAGGQHVVRLQ